MDIQLYNGGAVENVEKLKGSSQITEDIELYYEIVGSPGGRTNRFKEILNPLEFKAKARYNRLDDKDFLRHHNFVFRKKQ